MNKITESLIEKIRCLEKDHTPDGWPAIKMGDISQLANAIEEYDEMINVLCDEWAEDHTYLQNIARLYYKEERVTGECDYSVPGIQDLADMLEEKIKSVTSGELTQTNSEVLEEESINNSLKELPADLINRIDGGLYGGIFQYFIVGVDGTLAQLGKNLPDLDSLRGIVSNADNQHKILITNHDNHSK